jgi:hypothetical protein
VENGCEKGTVRYQSAGRRKKHIFIHAVQRVEEAPSKTFTPSGIQKLT